MDAWLQGGTQKKATEVTPNPMRGSLKKRPAPGGTQATKKQATKKAKSGKVDGMTMEQHRRALGDKVKANIQVQKWCVEARTHATAKCALEVFERLVVPNAASVVPEAFSNATPVVVARVKGSAALAEIFGKTKISGGTRLGSWSADEADIIYFPTSSQLRIWWTMR